jgi:putative colanic acid biosynthesis acetyltransferase WcaF
MPERLHVYDQESRTRSPRALKERVGLFVWGIAWTTLCVWTPRPFSGWRVAILRSFGAKIHGKVFVHQRARIEVPWNLIMHNGSCIGDRAHIYSLAEVELGEGALVAQECYLCTGTHAFEQPNFPLAVAKITIGPECFLGARTFVLPGIQIGEGVVTGAASVVTNDLPPWMVCVGNPCKPVKKRERFNQA